jgi:hypothetical protein
MSAPYILYGGGVQGDATKAAYNRAEMVARRRVVMANWGRLVSGETVPVRRNCRDMHPGADIDRCGMRMGGGEVSLGAASLRFDHNASSRLKRRG